METAEYQKELSIGEQLQLIGLQIACANAIGKLVNSDKVSFISCSLVSTEEGTKVFCMFYQ